MDRVTFMVALLISSLMVTPLLGCTGEPSPGEEPSLRVAAVFPGSINDEGFNQSGYRGLKLIEEKLGAETAFSENTPIADFANTYRDFADQGYDVIIGHGFEFGDVALRVAPDYPEIKFIVDSNPVVSGPNIAGITGETWEAAYVLGVLAGLMTETGQIGGIAGFDFPILVAQMEAYRLGAESVRPDVKVTTVYVGTFEDVALAKEAALAQASTGIDVVFHVADAAGIGVLQAAEESGIWAIGWGLDQNHLAPQTVISSLLFDGALLLFQDVQMVVEGTWTGEIRLYGLETGVVGVAGFNGLVPEDVAAKVDEVKDQVASGEMQVPYITEATGN